MDPTGAWRIVEMELWDPVDLDLEGPAFIEFMPDHSGSFGFIAVAADVDWRQEESRVEFSWSGSDEGDSVNGRGWAEIASDGKLHGDASSFILETHRTSEPRDTSPRRWEIALSGRYLGDSQNADPVE